MIHPFQPKISHHWHKHADGLEHIRQVSLAAGGGNHRTQQVVKPENVHHIKILRSEEHTSELQSRSDLVCRLLLEKKKISDSDYFSPYDLQSTCAESSRTC